MLRTRIATALVLLAILLAVAFSRSHFFFVLVATAVFAAATWESFRLFGDRFPIVGAVAWSGAFLIMLFKGSQISWQILFAFCAAIWALRLVPALKIGLPPAGGLGNRLLNTVYSVALLGCFIAITALYMRSPLYLLSVMAIVWVADVGAYFSGKAFGRRKLAPSISPGKSWEGAIGGWIAVLLIGIGSVFVPGLEDTFAVQVKAGWGWIGLAGVLTLLSAASVVGDLFESQLKRRAGMKDSSRLLPGHGGVLDRIDALIPVLPVAVLLVSRL